MDRVCIGAEETKTLSPLFVFTGLGWQNISASASAFPDNLCCSGVLVDGPVEDVEQVGYDSVQHRILCEAQGLPQSYTHSAYICPNGRIN